MLQEIVLFYFYSSNTPKTLREVLPTLFNLLLGCLASNSYDKRQVAARTLGDLVKKLGERVLPEIIPILEKGLLSPAPEKRQGVCVGLSEIMSSTSRDMVLTFVNSLGMVSNKLSYITTIFGHKHFLNLDIITY